MNRRDFLQVSSVALLAASPLARALEADNEFRRNIGLQLYTLRNELGTDTPGTIKAIAKAGYKQAEMFGFPDCDPVIAACKDSGLALNSTHFQWDTVISPRTRVTPIFSGSWKRQTRSGSSTWSFLT
jgi:hypothetical protein